MFSWRMLDSSIIAASILAAPGWARVGITMPKDHVRERAAEELALSILGSLEAPPPVHDDRQLTLAL
jgi:hypothetical protein